MTPAEVTIHGLRLALPALLLATALATLAGAPATAAAETVHGIPLPRGTRVFDPSRPSGDLFVSGRGFRDTVEHVRRHLNNTGIPHQEIPVYRRGPVTVARFIARQPGLPWLAVHVFQQAGKTLIAVVPALPSRPLDPARR